MEDECDPNINALITYKQLLVTFAPEFFADDVWKDNTV